MDIIIKRVKLPKRLKKKVKTWYRKTFPNHPSKFKSKSMRLDEYLMGIYSDCKAEERLGLYRKIK